jgi:hypothetical protein
MEEEYEMQPTALDEEPTPARTRGWVWAIVGVLLVVILAGAAYMGGRYLQKSPQASGGGNGITISNGPGGQTRYFSKNDILPAEELPKTSPDARGIYVRRQDNSIFVGTGKVQLNLAVKPGGTPQSGSSYDGPLVEVVTTAKTQIYRDETLQNLQDLPASETKLQQKVVPGSLDEVGQSSMIQVWGKKVGDRLVADVFVYSNPAILNAPQK